MLTRTAWALRPGLSLYRVRALDPYLYQYGIGGLVFVVGLIYAAGIGVTITFFTKPEPQHKQRGLVWGTIADAIEHYKGAPGRETGSTRARGLPRRSAIETPRRGDALLAVVTLSRPLAEALGAAPGDLVYVSDNRWWLGGLRSVHAVVGDIDGSGMSIELGPETFELVVAPRRRQRVVSIERLY